MLRAVQAESGAGRGIVVVASIVLLLVAVAERLHNAWAAPVLSGYDAFGHFTYIWFVARTWHFPMATHGWSFFHPPLYYALMAGIWNALDGLDPYVRLKIGKVLVAALGSVQAPIAWYVVGRAFPQNRAVRAMAALLVLVVPVQLYSAGFLGNEGLHAVFGSLSLLALLHLLDAPSPRRAAVLGLCLGAAMAAKFSALAIVVASLATIAARALARRRYGEGARLIAVTAATSLVICGPWIVRNIEAYGTPFELSRRTFPVAYVENNQPQAARGWADYLTFDPLIFRRPVWPRDSTASSDPAPHDFERAVRESVWTGMYANTWFDGFGGWVLPPVVESEGSRRAGQALLMLGLIPTLLIAIGIVRALVALARRGWDDTSVAFAFTTAAMIVLLVQGTIEVPIAAAVKATYFTPIAVVFAFWFAHGAVWIDERLRALSYLLRAGFLVLAVLSLAVFWQGFLFDPTTITSNIPRFDEGKTVQDGIVKYAGGRVDEARALFRKAAATDYHLAYENLGFLLIDEGKVRAGLSQLRLAWRMQHRQVDGPIDADRFLRLAKAEYGHSIAVVMHDHGQSRRATLLWRRALRQNPQLSEALAGLSLTRLEDVLHLEPDEKARRAAFEEAASDFASVRAIDPGLADGWTLGAAVSAARGDCDGARAILDAWKSLPCWIERQFPAETGTGAGHSASIGRRRLARPRTQRFNPDLVLRACGIESGSI